ncbi:hypothetical protein OF381_12345 [Mannheimia haemolytica]
MSEFEKLMEWHTHSHWREEYPESLTQDEKFQIERMLDDSFKQGSSLSTLLDYLKALKLLRAYPVNAT